MTKHPFTLALAALMVALSFAPTIFAGDAKARTAEDSHLAKKLLRAVRGTQIPSSESDSVFEFASFPDEGVFPTPERFAHPAGCDPVTFPGGRISRLDFGATFDRWTHLAELGGYDVRDYRRLRRAFERNYEELAVYRCETGCPENLVYILGAERDGRGVSGLRTVSVET